MTRALSAAGTILTVPPPDSERKGRVVVAASFVALLVSPLGLSIPTAGLFVGPVSAEFGWNHATFFLGPSIGALVGAFLAPFLGAIADRWGVRPTLSVGVIIYAFGVASLSTLSGWVPAYLGICVILFAAGQVQTSSLYSKVAASWFDRRRGLMISIATSGFGVGGFIIPPLTRHLLDRYGWRHTYAALGLLIAAVALPVVLFVIRESPAVTPTALLRRSTLGGVTLRQAMQSRTYWKLIAFFLCLTFALTGVAVNLVPLMTRRGVAPGIAVLAVSALSLSQTIGRLCSGYLLDRRPLPNLSIVWFVGSAIGLTVLFYTVAPVPAIFAAALLGLSWGAEGEMTGYLVSRYFGVQYLARISGSLFVAIGLMTAASQMFVAHVFDLTQSYEDAIMVSIAVMIVACALFASLPPYVFKPEEPALPARHPPAPGNTTTLQA